MPYLQVNGIAFCFCNAVAPSMPLELLATELQTSALAVGHLASLVATIAATFLFYPLLASFG